MEDKHIAEAIRRAAAEGVEVLVVEVAGGVIVVTQEELWKCHNESSFYLWLAVKP